MSSWRQGSIKGGDTRRGGAALHGGVCTFRSHTACMPVHRAMDHGRICVTGSCPPAMAIKHNPTQGLKGVPAMHVHCLYTLWDPRARTASCALFVHS